MLIGFVWTQEVFLKSDDLEKTIPVLTVVTKQKVEAASIRVFISLQERKKSIFKVMMLIMAKIRKCQYKNIVQILYQFQKQRHVMSLLKAILNLYIYTQCLHKASNSTVL